MPAPRDRMGAGRARLDPLVDKLRRSRLWTRVIDEVFGQSVAVCRNRECAVCGFLACESQLYCEGLRTDDCRGHFIVVAVPRHLVGLAVGRNLQLRVASVA